mgnify:CR=1 FL=1
MGAFLRYCADPTFGENGRGQLLTIHSLELSPVDSEDEEIRLGSGGLGSGRTLRAEVDLVAFWLDLEAGYDGGSGRDRGFGGFSSRSRIRR